MSCHTEARYGEFAEYMNRSLGPVVITDLSVDYESHPSYVASFDYNPYICDYFPKYNLSLTCGNPEALHRILDFIKSTDFSSEVPNKKLNASLRFIGKFDKFEDLPDEAKIGEMCVAGSSFYVYNGEKWNFIYTSDVSIEQAEETTIKYEITRYKIKHKILYKC